MNDTVYQKIRNSRDNSGRPLLHIDDDNETLLGKPVWLCPSLPLVGGSPSQFGTLLFGDLSAFHIRVTRPTLQRFSERYADFYQRAAIARVRMDSAYFDPSGGSAPPILSASVHP